MGSDVKDFGFDVDFEVGDLGSAFKDSGFKVGKVMDFGFEVTQFEFEIKDLGIKVGFEVKLRL